MIYIIIDNKFQGKPLRFCLGGVTGSLQRFIGDIFNNVHNLIIQHFPQ